MSPIHNVDQYAETETNCDNNGKKTGGQCDQSCSSSCDCTAYRKQQGWDFGNIAAAIANPASETERLSGQLEKENLSSGSHNARADHKVKPPAAAVPTSLPPEIWRLIGLMMPHPQTLVSLVRVSRAFRNIFTPILYARRIVNLEYFPDSEPLGERPLPPYLEHVQDFRVNVYEFSQTGRTYIPERNDEYAAWITRALESTRSLRYFSWRDESFVEDYKSALILHDPGLLRVLKGTETLKHICCQFSAIICRDVSPVLNCYIPLGGFRNLLSLELYDFYRDHNNLVKELSILLCDSPLLKKLGLGFACDRTQDDDEAIIFGGLGGETDFLERLCEYYGSICKTGPLVLETLRFGAGIYLGEGLKSENDHYLSKLLSARSLKVLHLANGLVNNDFDEDSFYIPIDWTPFPPEECTLLRQLSVSRLGEDVADWLRLEGNRVEELIVTDHYRLNDKDMNQFLRLPSSRLSMLWTREKYPWRSISYDDSDDDWTDTDSSIDEFSDVGSPTSDLAGESSGLQLCDVNASQLEATDPNSPKLDKRVMTVLDRLPDKGSHLERLCIALDFEEQWWHFSSHLKNLNRLAQLRINAKSWRGGEYPTLASSIWPDTAKDTPNAELALRFARLIGSMCPTLRYIMIGQELAWEVIWPSKERLGSQTSSQSTIGLRKLDNDEILEIELFAMTDFPEQGGMLGQERDREEKRVGKIHSIRELDAILVAQGLSPSSV